MRNSEIKSRMASLVLAVVMSMFAGVALAQGKVTDKDLVGVWVMESMQFQGENKTLCGTSEGKTKTVNVNPNYTQVKVYRANGEYACAEVVKLKDGQYRVLPHEYGTYTFKNGKYTEMGRNGELNLVSKTRFTGHFYNRFDVWTKSKTMPAKLVDYIVDKCKARQSEPHDIQEQIKKHVFK